MFESSTPKLERAAAKYAKINNQEIVREETENAIYVSAAGESHIKCTTFKKLDDYLECENLYRAARTNFEALLGEVFPLKLRIKIKREWAASAVKNNNTIINKYSKAFEAAKIRLGAKCESKCYLCNDRPTPGAEPDCSECHKIVCGEHSVTRYPEEPYERTCIKCS